MINKNVNFQFISSILKAVFAAIFLIALPISADNTYCYKGALIHQSYNSNVGKSVWTQGVGSNFSYIEQGYNTLSDAIYYIDTIQVLGYAYNQCQSTTPAPSPITPTPVDTQGYNCNSNSCVYTTSGAQYKASDYSNLGNAYNACFNQCKYIAPVPVSTAGYSCSYNSCTYVASNAQYKLSDYQNNSSLAYQTCSGQCQYIPPTPTYTYPEIKTVSINYDSLNDQLNLYGYLANLGNDTYARTGFCVFEKNYGFSCNTEITANNAQYNLGQFSKINYLTNNLKRSTQYCIRAFAQNSYGKRIASSLEDQCFYTRYDYYQPQPSQPPYYYGNKPTIRTTGINYYPTDTKANFRGYVDNIGSYQTARVGFCLYLQSNYFSCEQDLPVEYARQYNGEFVYYNFPTNSLLSNTTYCIRAYGENLAGRQYSNTSLDKCFTTNQYPAPYPTPQTILSVTKTATNGTECQTADITLTINCQSYSCTNVVVYEALPNNVNFISGSSNPSVTYFWPNKGQANKMLVWSIGNMNGTKIIKYRLKFNTANLNQSIADIPDSKLTYNDNGIITKNFPQISLNPTSCQIIPNPQPTPNPEPQPTFDCSYFENYLKDKFSYCGSMGYQGACFSIKNKNFLSCAQSQEQCSKYAWANPINCAISSNYNNYTIRNNNLIISSNTSLTANGYLYAGQGKAETGFVIYDKTDPGNLQYLTANANQSTGIITKNINISEIGGAGKQYCSKAYYVKGTEKIFSQEEKCYTAGGCYKGVIIYPIQNATTIFWATLPEYVRKNTFAEVQQAIDTKVSAGKAYTQCNY